MNHPISIFILDVSNSSSAEIGEELTNYLDEMVASINVWTKEFGHCKVKHRAGDEIIFAGYGYSTAYIIAFLSAGFGSIVIIPLILVCPLVIVIKS